VDSCAGADKGERAASRAAAGTAKVAVSAHVAMAVGSAPLRRKPAPRRGCCQLNGSMNGYEAMLYSARETQRHL